MAQTALFIYFSLSQISIAGGHIFATASLSYILFDENTEQLGQKESVFVLMWGIATSYKAEKRRSIFLFSGAFV